MPLKPHNSSSEISGEALKHIGYMLVISREPKRPLSDPMEQYGLAQLSPSLLGDGEAALGVVA